MMPRRRLGFTACRRGTAAVEFGLVALPFLLMVFGIIEYGRLMWTREALQQTAIAGARCMGMTQTACGTSGVYNATMSTSFVVAQAAKWSIPLSTSNVVLNQAATCGGVAGFSQVSLTYTYNTAAAHLLTVLAGAGTLTATACFPTHA